MREASKPDENGKIDEIEQYREARWVTPPEALWRIYGFELSKNSPPVMQLQLHLPNMHMVSFHQRQGIRIVVNCPGADRSMLTAYFEENRLDERARGILYNDFPEWYTWQPRDKKWQRRKQEYKDPVSPLQETRIALAAQNFLGGQNQTAKKRSVSLAVVLHTQGNIYSLKV
jgi:hypothetical protein